MTILSSLKSERKLCVLLIFSALSYGMSALAAGDESGKTSPKKQWWIADSNLRHCYEVNGPAARLDEYVGFADKPETRDFNDSQGNLVKVEVRIPVSGGVRVWTYYKDKPSCEAEQINATKSLADKYR